MLAPQQTIVWASANLRNCHVIWLKTAQIFFMDFEHPIKLVFPYLYTNTANSRGVFRRSSLCCVKERASLWLSVR